MAATRVFWKWWEATTTRSGLLECISAFPDLLTLSFLELQYKMYKTKTTILKKTTQKLMNLRKRIINWNCLMSLMPTTCILTTRGAASSRAAALKKSATKTKKPPKSTCPMAWFLKLKFQTRTLRCGATDRTGSQRIEISTKASNQPATYG